MLKRLELVGFKSFADKTQFDFNAGITAIVGPNGSGKSNIVDAVRWILGEQSAKSLRGGEMADVIFNGSTSRRSLGLAEVTMTFDNHRRVLATESEEVQITRRVYRSGEGEYLINQQVCRLKDIKELFLGSGAGADAYCIIEQGRVDVLLQSSTRERRTIFEEAAGISRFKAKKNETLRRLERVDQNLLRLRDIVDEVEKQLRSVKLQASKAQRYQEYSERLKVLRIALGLEEYQQLITQLSVETRTLEQLRAGLAERAADAARWEGEMRRLEDDLGRLEEEGRGQEGRLADSRHQIASQEATLDREGTLYAKLGGELAATRARMLELTTRVAALAETSEQVRLELAEVEVQCGKERDASRVLEDRLNTVAVRVTELNAQVQADKVDHLEQMRQAARLQNDVVSFKAQMDNLIRERERLCLKTEQATENLVSLDLELQDLTHADEALQSRLALSRQNFADQRQEREKLRLSRDETSAAISDLKAQHSGLVSRIEVLEGLERSHEGLGTGVREVMDMLAEERASSESLEGSVANRNGKREIVGEAIMGMVADFLTVRHEFAPLIDLALGERAQRILVRDAGLLDEILRRRDRTFSGRVSFLPLTPVRVPVGTPVDGSAGATLAEDGRRNGNGHDGGAHPNRLLQLSPAGRVRMPMSSEGAPVHPGVIALAEQLVSCEDPDLSDLPSQLLGRTLLVQDLATARAVAAHTTGYRLVTLQGELLEPDGTLTVGTHHAETGILSRKSELRELRYKVVALDARIVEADEQLANLRDRMGVLNSHAENLKQEIEVLAEQGADLRSRITQHRQRLEGLHEEVAIRRSEITEVEREIEQLQNAWRRAKDEAEGSEARVHMLQTRLEKADQEIRESEHERQQRQDEFTSAQVKRAKVEERLTALEAHHRQIKVDLEERQHERTTAEENLAEVRRGLSQCQHKMLEASSALAEWYLKKESAERRVVQFSTQRDLLRQQRTKLTSQTQAARNEWQNHQEEAHAHELQASELHLRQATLVDRLCEDYQLNLAELYRDKQQSEVPPESGNGPGENIGPLLADSGGTALAAAESLVNREASKPLNTDAVNEEIAELRRKLSRLGSVNLDSLQELHELETRAGSLQTQLDDLTSAKKSLEEIIATINMDSKRLFTDTFGTIRTHFQELFRKLFGGGMADVVLEDETDILDTGIEIIARPPGKELRSISLMSGGEKTMTAVALLLAIFRSRPSPFCILDEVDAALDEANIGRFTSVLREFLDRSQFIIITHSKRTMAAADVLYGITMQESGISRQVSVRFEDWPDDNQPEKAVSSGTGHDISVPSEAGFAGR